MKYRPTQLWDNVRASGIKVPLVIAVYHVAAAAAWMTKAKQDCQGYGDEVLSAKIECRDPKPAERTTPGYARRGPHFQALRPVLIRKCPLLISYCSLLISYFEMFPAQPACPHPQETSELPFAVSQWGLQYLLSLAAMQVQIE